LGFDVDLIGAQLMLTTMRVGRAQPPRQSRC
jgi:hypothetical protein